MVGDAAHAHGGAHATGSSLAIDDAYTLCLSLVSVFPVTSTEKPSPKAISKCLRVYEATRKPHVEKLLRRVLAANEAKVARIRIGQLESDDELRSRAAKGSDTTWLHEHDVVKAFQETLSRSEDDRGRF